jgi:hypothetical protein
MYMCPHRILCFALITKCKVCDLDAGKLPFESSSFDAVTCVGVLSYITKPAGIAHDSFFAHEKKLEQCDSLFVQSSCKSGHEYLGRFSNTIRCMWTFDLSRYMLS